MLPWEGDKELAHCFHLFVARILPEKAGLDRDAFVTELKERNIGTGIHYKPAHQHSFYRAFYEKRRSALPKEGLPHTDWSGDRLCSLPLWPGLTEDDQDLVVAVMKDVFAAARAKSRVTV
jgi:UDP-4-amino-4-deoxy-L-arabinose-oxoglutarate aminotransferase